MDFELSKHSLDMVRERDILQEWINRALNNPDWKNIGVDSNIHYFKSIAEQDERILHVVLNPQVTPVRVVTVFFDRKARRKK